MKIGNKVNPSVQNANMNSTDRVNIKSNKQNPSVGAKSLGESSKVDVSSRAQMMNKAKEIASEQTVDEAKVARLQGLIDSGKYKVDAQAIADRLVDEQLMMPE